MLEDTFLRYRYIVPQVRINKWALSLFNRESDSLEAVQIGVSPHRLILSSLNIRSFAHRNSSGSLPP